jgi:2-succinyl-5-enolpyruvyl-6-hydroxy-3-cyclohexene-1-carboxylate synthase
VANLLPACVEAFYSGVPLVLLTADRPPELRGKGANQTIRQEGLFGSFVRFAADLPCPGGTADFGELFSMLRQAVEAATGKHPGPVHLNVPFREPLLAGSNSAVDVPAFDVQRVAAEGIPAGFDLEFFFCGRGVVLIGRLPAAEQESARLCVELGERLGWPVIADALSGAKGLPGVVRHADWILQAGGAPAPERILHFGGAFVSKRLGEWQSACRGKDCLQVRLVPEVLDPFDQNPVCVISGIEDFFAGLGKIPTGRFGNAEAWRKADAATGKVLDDMLGDRMTEPGIARVLAECGGKVFLGNSMPVRDFDACAVSDCRTFGNRGASGIDGNIATMAGIAMAGRQPLTGVLGDLAALHDLNSLPLLRGLPVALVVVNNDGGGIFRFLPLDVADAERERLWETPHGFGFAQAASQFGLRHVQAGTSGQLRRELESGVRPVLIECRTDRGENHRLHAQIAGAVGRLGFTWD